MDLVARYGGEEFAVILPGTLIGAATRVAERILKRIREMNLPHERSKVSEYRAIEVSATRRNDSLLSRAGG